MWTILFSGHDIYNGPLLVENNTPTDTPPPHLSMHTFISNFDDLHVILHTYDLFMETTPTYSLQCCLDKSCKQSYHKSWLFKVLFAQGTVYYSVLNKRWINLSVSDKCKAGIKPLESSLKILTHPDNLLPYDVLYSIQRGKT